MQSANQPVVSFHDLVMAVSLPDCELGSYTVSALTLKAQKCPYNYSSMKCLTAKSQ